MRSILILVLVLLAAIVVWFAFLREPVAPIPVPERTPAVATPAIAAELDAPPSVVEPAAPSARRVDQPGIVEPTVDEPAAPPRARLVVRVVAHDTRAPLARARVSTRAAHATGRMQPVERTTGTVGEMLWTDAEGRATFDVEPGQELQLFVSGGDTSATPDQRTIDALRDAEERAIDIGLAVDRDHEFYGRVLERTTHAPVVGAAILSDCDSTMMPSIGDSGSKSIKGAQDEIRPELTTTDGDGVFHIAVRGRQPVGLTVKSAGFGPHWVGTMKGHDTVDSAFEILIDRGATLRVQVVQVDRAPLANTSVRFDGWIAEMSSGAQDSARYLDALSWSADTDVTGVAVLADLPPNVELRGTASRGGKRIFTLADPLTLTPGEDRAVTWTLGGGSEIHGVVREQDGTPVPKFEVWLQRATTTADTYFRSYDESQSRRIVRTDARGAYRFQDVAPGSWWLGPHSPGNVVADPAAEAAPIGRFVELSGERAEIDITLVRGLVIRGTILAPDGRPAAGGQVHAFRLVEQMFVDSRRVEGGAFVVGPLVPGKWTLEAVSAMDGTRSEPVEAGAGDTGVVLRLRKSAEVRVHVVDASGADVAGAAVVVTTTDGGQSSRTNAQGVFVSRGLRAGPLTVSASTDDGRWASCTGLTAKDGANAEVELVLEAGVVGSLRCVAAEPGTRFSVERDGIAVAYAFATAGNTTSFTLPVGRSTLRAFAANAGNIDREIDVAAGSSPEFVFDRGWQ
jgi:hypothetical protein